MSTGEGHSDRGLSGAWKCKEAGSKYSMGAGVGEVYAEQFGHIHQESNTIQSSCMQRQNALRQPDHKILETITIL